MAPTRRARRAIATLVAIPLALSACSIGVGSTAETSSPSTGQADAEADSGSATTGAESAPTPTAQPAELAVIASHVITNEARDYTVDLNRVEDDGNATTVTLTLTNHHNGSILPTGFFGAGLLDVDASGVELWDNANQMIYTCAYTKDDDGNIDYLSDGVKKVIDTGESRTYVATSKTLPVDVTTIDVMVPNAGDVFTASIPELTLTTLSGDVNFEVDSANLTSRAKEILDGLVGEWKAVAPPNVHIVGHTDDVDIDAYNQDLSERRAKAVGDYPSANLPGMTVTTEGRGSPSRSQTMTPTRDEPRTGGSRSPQRSESASRIRDVRSIDHFP